jgi:hypothetical protein
MLGKKKTGQQEKDRFRMNEEEIRVAAYYRWQGRGGSHGADLDDWLKAEKHLHSSRHGKAGKRTKVA